MARRKANYDFFEKELPSARLYRDDLEMIVTIIKENLDSETRIETDTFKLDSIAELAHTCNGETSELNIRSGTFLDEDYFHLSLYANPSLLHTNRIRMHSGSNAARRGVTEQIADLLAKHEARPLEYWNWWVLAGVLIPAQVIAFFASNNLIIQETVILSILIPCYLIYLGIARILRPRQRSGLLLTYRHNQPASIFDRNRDDIFVNLLTGIVLLIVGGIIGYFIGS